MALSVNAKTICLEALADMAFLDWSSLWYRMAHVVSLNGLVFALSCTAGELLAMMDVVWPFMTALAAS